jgi:hypothetical protein
MIVMDKIINSLAWKIAKAELYYINNKDWVEFLTCIISGFAIGIIFGLIIIAFVQ